MCNIKAISINYESYSISNEILFECKSSPQMGLNDFENLDPMIKYHLIYQSLKDMSSISFNDLPLFISEKAPYFIEELYSDEISFIFLSIIEKDQYSNFEQISKVILSFPDYFSVKYFSKILSNNPILVKKFIESLNFVLTDSKNLTFFSKKFSNILINIVSVNHNDQLAKDIRQELVKQKLLPSICFDITCSYLFDLNDFLHSIQVPDQNNDYGKWLISSLSIKHIYFSETILVDKFIDLCNRTSHNHNAETESVMGFINSIRSTTQCLATLILLQNPHRNDHSDNSTDVNLESESMPDVFTKLNTLVDSLCQQDSNHMLFKQIIISIIVSLTYIRISSLLGHSSHPNPPSHCNNKLNNCLHLLKKCFATMKYYQFNLTFIYYFASLVPGGDLGTLSLNIIRMLGFDLLEAKLVAEQLLPLEAAQICSKFLQDKLFHIFDDPAIFNNSGSIQSSLIFERVYYITKIFIYFHFSFFIFFPIYKVRFLSHSI